MSVSVKLVVEKHPDTYVAYPLGIEGVVVGQGPTYEAALEDVRSALAFHLQSFEMKAVQMDVAAQGPSRL